MEPVRIHLVYMTWQPLLTIREGAAPPQQVVRQHEVVCACGSAATAALRVEELSLLASNWVRLESRLQELNPWTGYDLSEVSDLQFYSDTTALLP